MFKSVSQLLFAASTMFAIGCLATPVQSHAQGYPTAGRPIKVVVPTAAGGSNDVMARIIAQKLSERMNRHSVTVGNQSLDERKRARADCEAAWSFGAGAGRGVRLSTSVMPRTHESRT
jgi:hypothetical protein